MSLAPTHDVIVIGAGPAGLAAATTAARLGLKTALVDEQPRPGGQIYRDLGVADARVASLLGPDYRHGQRLLQALQGSPVETRFDSLVWDVDRALTVTALHAGTAFQWRAPQLIAATGALERASPIPGWTLPGVMNAGAAQIALKSSSAIPSGRVVLAGSGPLLLLVALQLQQAGAELAALVETTPAANRRAALRWLPAALQAPAPLFKGLRLLRQLRSAGLPWFKHATALAVDGGGRAQALRFHAGGREHGIAADTVLLHHGVLPDTQLSRLLRLDHVWSDAQLAWQVRTDAWGQTSLPGLRLVGDGAAIAGARAAEAAGALAALAAAQALGRLSEAERNRQAAPLRQALQRELRCRPFLDALYRPPAFITHPPDEVLVCRCEEVSAGRVREMARLGCQGPNQTKFFSRCGMGPCQGRQCGNVVTQLLAAELGRTPQTVGAYRIRAPLKPVPLGALAALAEPGSEVPRAPGLH